MPFKYQDCKDCNYDFSKMKKKSAEIIGNILLNKYDPESSSKAIITEALFSNVKMVANNDFISEFITTIFNSMQSEDVIYYKPYTNYVNNVTYFCFFTLSCQKFENTVLFVARYKFFDVTC